MVEDDLVAALREDDIARAGLNVLTKNRPVRVTIFPRSSVRSVSSTPSFSPHIAWFS